jgi:EmrB/QacA subfamily drug resistance transporter
VPAPAALPDDGAPNKERVLVVVSLGVFMAVLDSSIVNLALPQIAAQFSIDATQAEPVITAYLIAIASTLLLIGAIADRVGRRPLYLAGVVVFTVGSGLCAASTSLEPLVAFRVVQAIGASLMFAIGPAILTSAYPARQRGAALGAIGTAVAAGQTVGPVLGGLLLHMFGWPSIFLVNLPIGIVAFAMSRRELAPAPAAAGGRPPFDRAGAVLLPVALFTLTVSVELIGVERGVTAVSAALLAAVGVLLVALRSVERRARAPLFDPVAARSRAFVLSNAAGLTSFIAIGGVFLIMPFYMEGVLHYEAYKMGLMLLPIPAAIALIAPFSGRLSDRIGTRIPCVAGMALAVVAFFSLATLGAQSTEVDLLWRLALFGGSVALFQSPNNSTIMGSVERRLLGLASGMMATMRTLGIALGVAGGAGLLAYGYAAASGGVPLPPADVVPDASAFVSAQSFAFLVMAGMCALAIVASAARPSPPRADGAPAVTASSRGR